MLKRVSCTLISLSVVAGACNAILGIEEPVERRSDASLGNSGGAAGGSGGMFGGSGGKDAAQGGSSGTAGFASNDGALDALPDVPDPDPPCDPTEQAGDGIFVSAEHGDDGAGDGSKLNPLQTVTKGLQVASATKKPTVYLDVGTYAEKLVFTSAESGIEIRGGFKSVGATWERDCGARKLTLLRSPDAIAVEVAGTSPVSGLRELTVTTKPVGASPDDAPGESVYAIKISGDGTKFSLFAVTVIAGAGGPGGKASPGTTPAKPTATCGGSCDTGAAGIPGEAAKNALDSGFSISGYTPGDGEPGNNGQPGKNGVAGKANSMSGCVLCNSNCGAVCGCTCCDPGCLQGCTGGSCSFAGTETKTSPVGPCGCGGPGGLGGKRGRGGGASIALFAGGNATVSASYSSLNSASGGDGSIGGASASGVQGSDGVAAKTTCAQGNCICSASCGGPSCWCGTDQAAADVWSAPGGKGGTGGEGTSGGGGSGGPSYAVVLAGSATLVDSNTILGSSTGGVGASGAPAGGAGPKLIVLADAGTD